METKIKKSGIYVISNSINNKIYIGSAYNLHKRKLQHFNTLRNNKHKNSKLQNAYNKYGESNFEFDVLEFVDVDKLLDCEQKWMDFFKPEYNIIPYADRREFSESHRKNLSISHLGHKHTEESKIKIGLASKGNKYRKGVKISDEHKEKNRKALTGLKRKRGKDNHLYGRKRPIEDIEKMKKTRFENHGNTCVKNYKKVLQFNKDGSFIKEWESIKDASKELNINRSKIGAVANKNKNRNTAGGFKWEFKIEKNE